MAPAPGLRTWFPTNLIISRVFEGFVGTRLIMEPELEAPPLGLRAFNVCVARPDKGRVISAVVESSHLRRQVDDP
jgi:hypothetical protein